MQIYAIRGSYCMEVYAAKTQQEAWELFIADHAYVYGGADRPPCAGDLHYPWDQCTIEDMCVLDVTKAGLITGYME